MVPMSDALPSIVVRDLVPLSYALPSIVVRDLVPMSDALPGIVVPDLVPLSYAQGWASVLFKRAQRSRVLLRSFQKNETFTRSFTFFIKRTLRSLRSFMFFIKESCVLCVLLRSL